jgi:hypothetical protein
MNSLQKQVKNIEENNNKITEHYNFKSKLTEKYDHDLISVSLLYFKDNVISLKIPFFVKEKEVYMSFSLRNEDNKIKVVNNTTLAYLRMQLLKNDGGIRAGFGFGSLINRDNKATNLINDLTNELEEQQIILDYVVDIVEMIEDSALDIFNFYAKMHTPKTNLKKELKKEILLTLNNLSEVIVNKIVSNFSRDDSESFEQFFLRQAKCNSIKELKEVHNNTNLPIYLPFTFSSFITKVITTPSESNNYIENKILWNSTFDMFNSILAVMYVKNNRLMFNATTNYGSVVSKKGLENLFNNRVCFKNKKLTINSIAKLKNNEEFNFYLDDKEKSQYKLDKHLVCIPNDKIADILRLFDNI